MNQSSLVFVMGIIIALAHLRNSPPPVSASRSTPAEWPATFEGRQLNPLPLTAMERSFVTSFPGTVAHFRCGENQVIFRRVTRATRKLHSSATCLKAAGYEVRAITVAAYDGGSWATYDAVRGATTLQVREQIRSVGDPGNSWAEVSEWFWHAIWHADGGPWLAVTVIRPRTGPQPSPAVAEPASADLPAKTPAFPSGRRAWVCR